jgi:hypothetical protein
MEKVADVLSRFEPDMPDEITAIKQYIEKNFSAGANVALKNDAIIVTVNSGSLANTLRLRITDLRRKAGTSKRIVFRIG